MSWLQKVFQKLGLIEQKRDTEKRAADNNSVRSKGSPLASSPESTSVTTRRRQYYNPKFDNPGPESVPTAIHHQQYDNLKFDDLTSIVKPLLQEMAKAYWIDDFRYEPDPDDLKWSIWKTDSVYLNSEYWRVKFIPTTVRFEIKCADERIIESGVSRNELENALVEAAKAGPVRENIARKVWH